MPRQDPEPPTDALFDDAVAPPPPMASSDDEFADVAFAQVAVERAVDSYPDGLTYRVPAIAAGEPDPFVPGARVTVPLGRGDTRTAGWIVRRLQIDELAPALRARGLGRVKCIRDVDDAGARLPEQLVTLARWIASYYATPIGMTLASMLPASVKHGTGLVVRTEVDLAPDAEERFAAMKRAPARTRIIEALRAIDAADRPIERRALLEHAGVRTPTPLRALADAGVVTLTTRSEVAASWVERAGIEAHVIPTLSDDQRTVVEAIVPRLGDVEHVGGFSRHLVFGVTGSGKTEVYLRLIERTLALGRVALVLVPEISLTPQTGGRIVARFPDHRVAILHSGLTASQRHQQWAMAARGEVDIVLGARSAVFAPIPDDRLGLVIVDEEHDGSYKQDQAPRYHGRDVAVRRAQLAECPIVLASATPSLETWHNATRRDLVTLHRLPHRAPGLSTPVVRVVDFAQERKRWSDRRVHLLGPTLRDALDRTLRDGAQALLLLNRRGYANWIACASVSCGWTMRCDACDAGMICHRTRLPRGPHAFVRCHHCLTEQRLPERCPDCGGGVTVFGLGTQRIEEELAAEWPDVAAAGAIQRVDADSMGGASDFHDVLERFGRGEIRILLGTQMIAKGLDFPGVRLVGVISADTALNLPDFRAAERTYQLVSQVAGRCGRGDAGGLAIIQSFQPDAPAIRLAAESDFEAFAEAELTDRARFGLPPVTRLARLVVRDEDEQRALARAQALADRLAALPEAADVRLRGPEPCPIARISERWRMQIELVARQPAALVRLLSAARDRAIVVPGADLAVDVDPVALM